MSMLKQISALIAIAFVAIFMSGCGAGGERNAKDASSFQARLEQLEEENEEYKTRIAELEAQRPRKKKTKTRTSRRRSVFGSSTTTSPEREADEPSSEAEPPARAAIPMRRSAVDPRACGGVGPGVGRVFADMKAARAYAETYIVCNGLCQFLTNHSGSWMSVHVNSHAVTLCNDSELSFPIPVDRKVGRERLPEMISTVPPGYVVVLGKFFRPTSFHVELHDLLGPGPFKTLFVTDFGEVFPNRRAGPNGLAKGITPSEMRRY